MWIVAKYKKNKILQLKSKTKILFKNSILYSPKILINYFKNNKLINKEVNLLNDYIFIFSHDFKKKDKLNNLNFTKGIKFVLNNSSYTQKELEDFISKCKNFENSKGYLKQEFFNFVKNDKYKFSSGPFTNLVFSIIKETQKQIELLIGNKTYRVKKDKYLYFPI